MVSTGARHTTPNLRLTRRGRVVVLALLAVIAAVASAVIFTTASRASASAPAVTPPAAPPATVSPAKIVVRSGDTLWSVAAATVPGRDRATVVAELRRINHLDGDRIRPGEVLILPS